MKNKRRCQFCAEFTTGEVMKKGERYCSVAHETKTMDTPACDNFTITKLFYCSKRTTFIDVVVCQSIRIKKRNEIGSNMSSPKAFAMVYSMCYDNCEEGRIVETLLAEPTLTIMKRRIT
jgi:hypothetical protein